jgi:hypothetical protein
LSTLDDIEATFKTGRNIAYNSIWNWSKKLKIIVLLLYCRVDQVPQDCLLSGILDSLPKPEQEQVHIKDFRRLANTVIPLKPKIYSGQDEPVFQSRIRIRSKIVWVRNTALKDSYLGFKEHPSLKPIVKQLLLSEEEV